MIHGNCSGVDKIAASACPELGLVQVPVPYFDWLGQRGGPERNRVMLHMLLAYHTYGYAVRLEAFPMLGSRGTVNMINQAHDASIDVVETWG